MKILISIWEAVKIAFRSIWSSKMRAILTLFGIIIGIVSVTTMQTMIDGIDRAFTKSLSMLGNNVLFVQKWPMGGGGDYKWWEYINRPEMQYDYGEKIEDYSKLAQDVAVTIERSVELKYKKLNATTQLDGVTPSYIDVAGIKIADGRFFTDQDNHTGRDVVVIGNTIAENLFKNEYPLGKKILVDGHKYTVIGILEKQGKFLGMIDIDNVLYVPFNSYKKYFSTRWGITIRVKYEDDKTLQEGLYELEGVMRRIRRVDALEENNFAINQPTMFKEQFDSMVGIIYIIGYFLTGLSLLVGGIGVMNIMYVSVKERTKEIGIRKAVGAKFWQIMLQFLLEAVVITMVGGVIGVLISLGVTQLINQVFVAYMDWTTVFIAVSICTIVGLFFGFMPAFSAARANTIDSLRFE